MKIVELKGSEFEEFAKKHPLSNYCQTSSYALLMAENGYEYDYIGFVDDENTIHAASLILKKKITGKTRYGYAPKGFLINYYDQELLRDFLNQLVKYYRKQDFVFIKFNPEIIIGETCKKNNLEINYNGNVRIIDDLKSLSVKRRMEIQEFDLLQPKFNAYINLKEFNIMGINRNYRKKIKHAINKGLSITLGGPKDIELFYSFVKNKVRRPLSYYRNLYNLYNKTNSVDLLFVKIDYAAYLSYIKDVFQVEQENNDKWNDIVQADPTNKKNLNCKMDSDIKLQFFKEEIIRATDGLKKDKEKIIGSALVLKNRNRVSILVTGYSDDHKRLNPNHFLHYSIFERYKQLFTFCDLNGVSGKFDETSKFKGLNDFKINWNSTIYEFVGEFDLIVSERLFKKLIKTSFIEDEFSKDN